MAIGTISETRGPTTFAFATFEEEGGLVPFQLCEKPTGFGQGELPSGNDMLSIGLYGKSLDEAALHLVGFMRRRKRINPAAPSGEPIFSIDGHLDLTVIRPEGYEQRVLRQWSDVIGEDRPVQGRGGGGGLDSPLAYKLGEKSNMANHVLQFNHRSIARIRRFQNIAPL